MVQALALTHIMIFCRDRGADDGWWGRLRCPGPSNASPFCIFLVMAHRMPLPCCWTFLVMAHRMPLPWVNCLVMAHRMPLPLGWHGLDSSVDFLLWPIALPLPSVDSSSWPIACLSLLWASSSWPIERLSLLWVAPAGQRNIDSNKQFHQLLKRRVTKRPPFVILSVSAGSHAPGIERSFADAQDGKQVYYILAAFSSYS